MEQATENASKPASFEQIMAEFKALKKSLPKDEQQNPNLWGEFLLNRVDDGGWVFARTVDDSLHGMRQDVTKLVEAGKLDEAAKLGVLTKALGERYSAMFSPVEEQGGTRYERVIAPPASLA